MPREPAAIPAPDEAWLPATAADWWAFWNAPQAKVVSSPHLRPLRRLFALYDMRDRFAAVGMCQTLVSGSTGQPALNPLLRHLPTLDAEILALEGRFGLTPQDSMKLGEAIGDAHRSLSEINARLAAAAAAAPSDEDDLRHLVFVPSAAVG